MKSSFLVYLKLLDAPFLKKKKKKKKKKMSISFVTTLLQKRYGIVETLFLRTIFLCTT